MARTRASTRLKQSFKQIARKKLREFLEEPPTPASTSAPEPAPAQPAPTSPDPNRDPNRDQNRDPTQGVRKDGVSPHELRPGEFAAVVMSFGGESYEVIDQEGIVRGKTNPEPVSRKLWFFCTPNGLHGTLDDGHVVKEHEDGMITVTPCTNPETGIFVPNIIQVLRDPNGDHPSAWQGYIRHGHWEEI